MFIVSLEGFGLSSIRDRFNEVKLLQLKSCFLLEGHLRTERGRLYYTIPADKGRLHVLSVCYPKC